MAGFSNPPTGQARPYAAVDLALPAAPVPNLAEQRLPIVHCSMQRLVGRKLSDTGYAERVEINCAGA